MVSQNLWDKNLGFSETEIGLAYLNRAYELLYLSVIGNNSSLKLHPPPPKDYCIKNSLTVLSQKLFSCQKCGARGAMRHWQISIIAIFFKDKSAPFSEGE